MEAYRHLCCLYLVSLVVWSLSAVSWTINTWKRHHWQKNHLQWILACVPIVKVLQLLLSFLFWHYCFNLQTCSLWLSFGVYISGVCFQTACFVSLILISNGYCIMTDRLSLVERRVTAAIGLVQYLSNIGYKAHLPYFTVLLTLVYILTFYVIFLHITQTLLILQEQMTFIEPTDDYVIHDAIYSKYIMFTRFRSAMLIIIAAEIMIHLHKSDSTDTYWIRLLVREVIQFCLIFYIGWTFRSKEDLSQLSVFPTQKLQCERAIPPIYRLELDVNEFKNLVAHEWHIGVPTYSPFKTNMGSVNPTFVVVRHPSVSS